MKEFFLEFVKVKSKCVANAALFFYEKCVKTYKLELRRISRGESIVEKIFEK